jgi:predicted type IV restriction endonuclease
MVQFIHAQNATLSYLETRFGLQLVDDETFFTEWLENLPEITDIEKQELDKVKLHFLRLNKRLPLLEDAVKLVVLSPLLSLAGFYDDPFFIKNEEPMEISLEDEGEIIRGRIDILVIQQYFWLLVIESKRASFSLLEVIPQALTYMLGNPQPETPAFGLVTNGSHFIFLKLTNENTCKYAISDEFSLLRRENKLYQVLKVLKKLGQILS